MALVLAIAVGGCGDEDDPVEEASWSLLLERHSSALLAAWGSSATDVWVVGGDARDGQGPTVLHYDGAEWTQLDTGERNVDLWWVFGFDGGPVFFGGSTGTILRYQDGAFEKLSTPGTGIVFGMWGSAPDDVWAVGGQFGGTGGFAWRSTGGEFALVPGVPADFATGASVWKVSGSGPDDVWMSCSLGAMLHWNGSSLDREDVGVTGESLFSVAGGPGLFVAVGGNTTNGVLYENAGSGWVSRVPTADGPIWRGAAMTGDDAYAVGQFGVILRRDATAWVADNHGLTTESLHAAWVDPDGGVWAVGGKFDRAPTIDGVLIHKGTDDVPPVP